MTLQDAIKGMMDFYRRVKKVYADLPEEVKIANEVKQKLDDCFTEADEAFSELEKMQIVGIDCKHCKFNTNCKQRAPLTNACRECMFFWLASTDQKRPLNYEPL